MLFISSTNCFILCLFHNAVIRVYPSHSGLPGSNKSSIHISSQKCIQPSSAFHPVQFQPSTEQVMQPKVEDLAAASIGQPREIQRQVQVHHHHHHYHHHHHIHSMQLQPPDHDDMSPQCGSSTMFIGPVEGNAANYSIYGSNSGSNHGSNVQNGSSTAVNAVGMNIEIANGIADKTLAGGS